MSDNDKGLGANNVHLDGTWTDNEPRPAGTLGPLGGVTLYDSGEPAHVDIGALAQGLQKKGK